MTKFELPTDVMRRKVLKLFQELTISRKDIQSYYQLPDIYTLLTQAWEGDDKPSLSDIDVFLQDAAITRPHEYVFHKKLGFRYMYERDH